MILLLLTGLASATSGFDPTAPAATFTGPETRSADGSVVLWSAIERLEDPDRTLLSPEAFAPAVAWADNAPYAPHIGTCFGTSTPGAHAALLHVGLRADALTGTPVLLVPGAGDNASRAFTRLATALQADGHPVYALTFAHPHGDVFKQAELLADAIARVRHRTGASQVDLVAHSKGGLAATVYLSNAPGTDWPSTAYERVGTAYQGDVRRAVFVASPLGGVDLVYRWSNNNLSALDAESALSPTSWSRHYPLGTANLLVYTDLVDQDFLRDGADLFPGQRQTLARQPHPLPYTLPVLGAYAVQQDNLTTYEGGYGAVSYSAGIDEAIAQGGHLIDLLTERGADPGVELYVLAGDSPLMVNGMDWIDAVYGDAWGDLVGDAIDTWAAFVSSLVVEGLLPHDLTRDEVAGLASGDLLLGEVTGASDGVVFVSSATATRALTARGAAVVDVHVAELSHLDLLLASPQAADELRARAATQQGAPWMNALAVRYAREDSVGWVVDALRDPVDDPDTGDTDAPVDTGDPGDTGEPADSDDTDGADPGDSGDGPSSCGGCQSSGAPWAALPWLVLGLACVRRRR